MMLPPTRDPILVASEKFATLNK